jgi:hypothetical protein
MTAPVFQGNSMTLGVSVKQYWLVEKGSSKHEILRNFNIPSRYVPAIFDEQDSLLDV